MQDDKNDPRKRSGEEIKQPKEKTPRVSSLPRVAFDFGNSRDNNNNSNKKDPHRLAILFELGVLAEWLDQYAEDLDKDTQVAILDLFKKMEINFNINQIIEIRKKRQGFESDFEEFKEKSGSKGIFNSFFKQIKKYYLIFQCVRSIIENNEELRVLLKSLKKDVLNRSAKIFKDSKFGQIKFEIDETEKIEMIEMIFEGGLHYCILLYNIVIGI
jgi:regulator of replication initiation timing